MRLFYKSFINLRTYSYTTSNLSAFSSHTRYPPTYKKKFKRKYSTLFFQKRKNVFPFFHPPTQNTNVIFNVYDQCPIPTRTKDKNRTKIVHYSKKYIILFFTAPKIRTYAQLFPLLCYMPIIKNGIYVHLKNKYKTYITK